MASKDPILHNVILQVRFPPTQHDPKELKTLPSVFGVSFDGHQEIQGGARFTSSLEKPDAKEFTIRPDSLALSIINPQGDTKYCMKIFEDIFTKAIKNLRLQLFLDQKYVIRKLLEADKGDARQLIVESLASKAGEKLKAFGNRPIHGIGVRIFLPPINEERNALNVKIESFLPDPRLVFIEVEGVFYEPLQAMDSNVLTDRLARTNDFLDKNVLHFLRGGAP